MLSISVIQPPKTCGSNVYILWLMKESPYDIFEFLGKVEIKPILAKSLSNMWEGGSEKMWSSKGNARCFSLLCMFLSCLFETIRGFGFHKSQAYRSQ